MQASGDGAAGAKAAGAKGRDSAIGTRSRTDQAPDAKGPSAPHAPASMAKPQPKKRTPFFIFCTEKRNEVRKAHPDMATTEEVALPICARTYLFVQCPRSLGSAPRSLRLLGLALAVLQSLTRSCVSLSSRKSSGACGERYRRTRSCGTLRPRTPPWSQMEPPGVRRGRARSPRPHHQRGGQESQQTVGGEALYVATGRGRAGGNGARIRSGVQTRHRRWGREEGEVHHNRVEYSRTWSTDK